MNSLLVKHIQPMSDSASAIPARLESLSDQDFQSALLQGVSRTFALTIPQLPDSLYPVVANAYLLCRIVDTIEDEISLSAEQKRDFCNNFIDVVSSGGDSGQISERLYPLLSDQTLPAEHQLIREIPRVIRITRDFSIDQQNALATCVRTMAGGMPAFQNQNLQCGLATMAEMDRYCYYVAGCVGEMLCRLFCLHSPQIAANEKQLLELSVSFGQGLQMTNILKDIWDDYSREVCWLPQEIFSIYDFDLADIEQKHHSAEFQRGLNHLIAIAHGHLGNALSYTLLIPAHETGIRNFCLWALGMAVLTLRKIHAHPGFSDPAEVKISRRSVQATVLTSRLCARSDTALELLFSMFSRGLEVPGVDPQSGRQPNLNH